MCKILMRERKHTRKYTSENNKRRIIDNEDQMPPKIGPLEFGTSSRVRQNVGYPLKGTECKEKDPLSPPLSCPPCCKIWNNLSSKLLQGEGNNMRHGQANWKALCSALPGESNSWLMCVHSVLSIQSAASQSLLTSTLKERYILHPILQITTWSLEEVNYFSQVTTPVGTTTVIQPPLAIILSIEVFLK